MQILIKLKEDSKFNRISSGIGNFRKGIVHTIDSKYFNESIMIKILEPSEKEAEKIIKDSAKKVEEKSKPKEVKVLSKDEIFKLNKKEQTKILKGLGKKKIPKFEKDRVNLILKLQK